MARRPRRPCGCAAARPRRYTPPRAPGIPAHRFRPVRMPVAVRAGVWPVSGQRGDAHLARLSSSSASGHWLRMIKSARISSAQHDAQSETVSETHHDVACADDASMHVVNAPQHNARCRIADDARPRARHTSRSLRVSPAHQQASTYETSRRLGRFSCGKKWRASDRR